MHSPANHENPAPGKSKSTIIIIFMAGLLVSAVGLLGILLPKGPVEISPMTTNQPALPEVPAPADNPEPAPEPARNPEPTPVTDPATKPVAPPPEKPEISAQPRPQTPADQSVKPSEPSAGSNQRVQNAMSKWSDTKTKIIGLIKRFKYQEAISLGNDFYNKEVIPIESITNSSAADISRLKKETSAYLNELTGTRQVFQNIISSLTPQVNKTGSISRKKISFDTLQIWVTNADETGIEGEIAGATGSKYYRQWQDIQPRIVYELLPNTTGKDQVYKAIFCYNHNLESDGEQILISYFQRSPQEKTWIDEILSRYDPEFGGIIPQGGFVIYQSQWVRPEDKYQLERGYVKYNGAWISFDQMMQLKGLVKFHDRWVTAKEKDRLDAQSKALEALKANLAPKGVIDKPGADTEQLAWNLARTKTTPHYSVKTNLSQDALNDIGYVMECLYYEFKKIFKLMGDFQFKLDVLVYKNQKEYYYNGGMKDTGGFFSPRKIGNNSGGLIMAYYQTNPLLNTSMVLLHEGTHQFLMLGTKINVPIWVNEGLATYYESSKFEGENLKTNLINKGRLAEIKYALQAGNYVKLGDFITTTSDKYKGGGYYAEGWSLMYFLFNWRDGFYADELEAYINYFRNNPSLTAQQHIDIFEQTFKTKVEIMEAQWKDYTKSLN
ncbi:MAG: DUF1570 domain-containing protein [Candidatus Brocadiia bacterium]